MCLISGVGCMVGCFALRLVVCVGACCVGWFVGCVFVAITLGCCAVACSCVSLFARCIVIFWWGLSGVSVCVVASLLGVRFGFRLRFDCCLCRLLSLT